MKRTRLAAPSPDHDIPILGLNRNDLLKRGKGWWSHAVLDSLSSMQGGAPSGLRRPATRDMPPSPCLPHLALLQQQHIVIYLRGRFQTGSVGDCGLTSPTILGRAIFHPVQQCYCCSRHAIAESCMASPNQTKTARLPPGSPSGPWLAASPCEAYLTTGRDFPNCIKHAPMARDLSDPFCPSAPAT